MEEIMKIGWQEINYTVEPTLEDIRYIGGLIDGFTSEEISQEEDGDLELDRGYWDCECENDYIHDYTESECERCGAEQDDQPNSRKSEVQRYLNRR
jgi:hypothetical protein